MMAEATIMITITIDDEEEGDGDDVFMYGGIWLVGVAEPPFIKASVGSGGGGGGGGIGKVDIIE